MKVALIAYNAGNVQSVIYALRRLGITPDLTNDVQRIQSADKVIFPGVGEARSAMQYLRQHNLDTAIASLKQPVLGICLGLQLLTQHSAENDTPCLGLFPQQVLRFPPTNKVPHMGWNTINNLQGPLFAGLPQAPHVYFVHGYYAQLGPQTTATTDYIVPFSAGLHRDNYHAVQFHPEKSGDIGAQILKNFLSL